jgi:hypothetical protein
LPAIKMDPGPPGIPSHVWSTSSIVAAFILALVAMALGLAGGAVVVAVPIIAWWTSGAAACKRG